MDKANPDKLFKLLELCCQKVAEKYSDKPFKDWTNRDYIYLSAALLRKTGVSISANTLKRIFGKLKTPDRYYPQKATRDALAVFAGFNDWEHFSEDQDSKLETAHRPASSDIYRQPPDDPVAPVLKKSKSGNFRLAYLILIILPLIVAVLYLNGTSEEAVSANLICPNPDGVTPHSAIFTLQVPEGSKKKDEFFIDFGDGRSKQAILPNQRLSHYYEIPGRYYALLLYKNKVIDTSVVYLKTDNWMATARNPQDTTRVYPLPKASIQTNGSLSVTPMQLYQAGIDTNHTFFVDFVNTKPLDVSGDDFELTANLKTSPDRAGVRCSPLYLYVYGERIAHFFYIHKSGCDAWIKAQFSDWQRDGSSKDIKAFVADLSEGGEILLRVKNKHVTLYINGKAAINLSYLKPVGNLYGINISFAGIGEIRSASIHDLKKDRVQYLFPAVE